MSVLKRDKIHAFENNYNRSMYKIKLFLLRLLKHTHTHTIEAYMYYITHPLTHIHTEIYLDPLFERCSNFFAKKCGKYFNYLKSTKMREVQFFLKIYENLIKIVWV